LLAYTRSIKKIKITILGKQTKAPTNNVVVKGKNGPNRIDGGNKHKPNNNNEKKKHGKYQNIY
jgi:hypothetical protein